MKVGLKLVVTREGSLRLGHGRRTEQADKGREWLVGRATLNRISLRLTLGHDL